MASRISWYLTLSAVLFVIGVAGFHFPPQHHYGVHVHRADAERGESELHRFAYQHKQVSGHIFTFFVMVVAAAEAAVGLAIILTVFKNRSTLNIDEIDSLKN